MTKLLRVPRFNGGKAPEFGEVDEGVWGGLDDRAEERIREDEEGGQTGGLCFFVAPVFQAGFEGVERA